jgi:hypothetical protein
MANIIKYRNLLNSFVDSGRAYSLGVKNELTELYLRQSMGLLEEFMYERNFVNGTIGSVNGKLVGVPHKIFDEIMDQYITLKSSISGETTQIQTTFLGLIPHNKEREYIKKVLLNMLEEELNNMTGLVMSSLNQLRTLQNKLSNSIDKLNLVTLKSLDGDYQAKEGGIVKAYTLTGTTELTKLTNDYNNSAVILNNYINNNIDTAFTKGYPGNEEYLFFLNRLCTNNITKFKFNKNRVNETDEIVRFRNGDLFKQLTTKDVKMDKGIRPGIQREFKFLLERLITPWIEYDTNLRHDRVGVVLDNGYETLTKGLTTFKSVYDVDYGIDTTQTSQNIIRVELKERNNGVRDNNFNHKRVNDLYIS